MNDWFYIWDTRTRFGWAAMAGTAFGARRLDFGFKTRGACLKKARLFTLETPAHKLHAQNTIAHPGPQKGPAWLFASVVAVTRRLAGENVSLSGIPMDWDGFTDFQKRVWCAALTIPYAQTRTYGWIAEHAGQPGAARAAGSALGANPLPLIVPCHRIIKSNGALGGFGMGADIKKLLLDNENAL